MRIEPTPDPVELAKLARALRCEGEEGIWRSQCHGMVWSDVTVTSSFLLLVAMPGATFVVSDRSVPSDALGYQ